MNKNPELSLYLEAVRSSAEYLRLIGRDADAKIVDHVIARYVNPSLTPCDTMGLEEHECAPTIDQMDQIDQGGKES